MPEALPFLILAAWEQWLTAIAPLVFLVLWVLGQISDAKKAAPPGRREQAAPPPQPNLEAGQPAAPAAGRPVERPAGEDALRDQVDEFLRRAGRPRQAPPQGRRRAKRSEIGDIEVLLDQEPPPPDRDPLAEPLRPIAERRTSQPAAPPTAKPKRPRQPAQPAAPRQSVSEHVAEHIPLSARSLGEQSSQLGTRIVLEDQKFEGELKARFAHPVGSLAAMGDARAEEVRSQQATATPAGEIASMLASPDGIRQAIVLNEILNRPSDRW